MLSFSRMPWATVTVVPLYREAEEQEAEVATVTGLLGASWGAGPACVWRALLPPPDLWSVDVTSRFEGGEAGGDA